MENIELINCPFCGLPPMSKPQFHRKRLPNLSYWTIVCLNCEFEGPECVTVEAATIHWNTRHGSKNLITGRYSYCLTCKVLCENNA